jgi:hypothetical protein
VPPAVIRVNRLLVTRVSRLLANRANRLLAIPVNRFAIPAILALVGSTLFSVHSADCSEVSDPCASRANDRASVVKHLENF